MVMLKVVPVRPVAIERVPLDELLVVLSAKCPITITPILASSLINHPQLQDRGQSQSAVGFVEILFYPSDRGQCYFFGHQSLSTSMWQTVDFGNQMDPLLIDHQLVKFNFSAWIGGINVQNDSVVVSLTFIDANNQIQGNATSLGPVLATDRADTSSFIFQQANGVVPAGARVFTVLVTITRFAGLQNNGDIDNIAVVLYL